MTKIVETPFSRVTKLAYNLIRLDGIEPSSTDFRDVVSTAFITNY